ncbi:hypothetical protein E3J39_03510 [Candidatus Bathyarchaeota archaeon]|nr:MAG: hypothetical protein E3J39_03510 [Candidatus Bathyarchaeota archaeon]
MPSPKWLVIAKYEYRIQTSWIRGIRRYFPFAAAGLLAVWVFYLAPMIVQSLMDDFLKVLVSQVAVALFEIILFMLSAFLAIMPVSNALKDEGGIGRVELMLKAPVRPGDVLVGEFLGKTPLYSIFAIGIAGLFTALLAPLGLSPLQTALIIFLAFVTCLFASWVGTVLAAVARTTLGRTAKGKDIGKALSFILVLPLVALMYGIMFGDILTALADPGTSGLVKTVLGLFPSSWAAEVIVAFAKNPSNIGAVWALTLTRVGGVVLFMVGGLAIGWKITDMAYSLEPTNLGVTVVGPDGAFYRTVKLLGGGGSFGSLLVSVFKDYGRRLENLSQIGYIVSLMLLINFFIVDDAQGSQIIGLLMGSMMALFLCSDATIRGKENLFIYRKTPSGVGRLMKAKLLQGWLLVLPFLAVVMVANGLRFNVAFTWPYLMSMGSALLKAAANVCLAMGVSLANPAYSQKSSAYFINVQLIVFLAMASIIIPDMVLHLAWLQMPMAWAIGLVMLFLGYRKLSTME